MKSSVLTLILMVFLLNTSCKEESKRDSDSNIFPKTNQKYYRKSEKELREIWEYIDQNTNDREWLVMDRNKLRNICRRGLGDMANKNELCDCSLKYLESKVEAHYIYSHSSNTLAFILGRASAEHCQ